MAYDAGTAIAFLKLDASGFSSGLRAAQRALSGFQAGSKGAAIGREMVNGMIAGVASRQGALAAQMRSLARAAVAAAKAELQIASPSKVFVGIGKNVADAFAQGVSGGQAAARRSMQDLVAAKGAAGNAPRAEAAARPATVVNLTVNGAGLSARELSRTLGGYLEAMNYGR